MRGSCHILVAGLTLAFATPAAAQNFGGAFAGMRDAKKPVQIEADRLEVTDEQGIAVFDGNVAVSQGSTLLKAKRLKVFYLRDAKGAVGPGGNVRRIEASGRVAVRSDDQAASADSATVDMQSQIAVLSGNVAISQGENIVTGCELKVNLATNAAVLEPCKSQKSGERVKMLFTPRNGAGN